MEKSWPEPAMTVAGIEIGTAMAGIRKVARRDLVIFRLAEGSRVAAVFTRNRFCAAPVQVCRKHLAQGHAIRALVVNTGNANAGTGERGLGDALAVCSALAQRLQLSVPQVLPFSTGVIMELLPVDRVVGGFDDALSDLGHGSWADAAQGIMTTDTVPKMASRALSFGGRPIAVTGIAKGAGMIRPNMATMLGFVATDANVAQPLLEQWVREAADESFNRITVDGDTSTNDSLVLIATGAAGAPELRDQHDGGADALKRAIVEVCIDLAQAIVRDGEGASKFITVAVGGGRDVDECRQVAYAVAHSPLVKTAFFASDPNLGRILAAVGYAGIEDLDPAQLEVHLDEAHVVTRGGRHPDYTEEIGQRVMQRAAIRIQINLGRGPAQAEVWTCDLSLDYVRINADYRS